MQNQIPKFKIRASAIGSIMTDPRGKSVAEKIQDIETSIREKEEKLSVTKSTLKTYQNILAAIEKLTNSRNVLLPKINDANLSQTCITFLEKWVNEKVYGRRIEATSKQTDKGNIVEDDSIIYASGYVSEIGLTSKNLDHFSDEDITGTPDIITQDYVFDIKSSWSHDTFPLYAGELPNTDYDWQVLGYMAMTGKKKGRVVFALMSMPEEMIMKEARWKLGYEFDQSQYQEFAEQFRYDDLPAYLRIREFEIPYDEEKIEAIRARVIECRAYINDTILPALEENKMKYQ